jgi:hypothetical protein
VTSPAQKRAQDLRELTVEERNPNVSLELDFLVGQLKTIIEGPSFNADESSYMWGQIEKYAQDNK